MDSGSRRLGQAQQVSPDKTHQMSAVGPENQSVAKSGTEATQVWIRRPNTPLITSLNHLCQCWIKPVASAAHIPVTVGGGGAVSFYLTDTTPKGNADPLSEINLPTFP